MLVPEISTSDNLQIPYSLKHSKKERKWTVQRKKARQCLLD